MTEIVRWRHTAEVVEVMAWANDCLDGYSMRSVTTASARTRQLTAQLCDDDDARVQCSTSIGLLRVIDLHVRHGCTCDNCEPSANILMNSHRRATEPIEARLGYSVSHRSWCVGIFGSNTFKMGILGCSVGKHDPLGHCRPRYDWLNF